MRANLSELALAYLAGFGLPDSDVDEITSALIWMHAPARAFRLHTWRSTRRLHRRRRYPSPDATVRYLAVSDLERQVRRLARQLTPASRLPLHSGQRSRSQRLCRRASLVS